MIIIDFDKQMWAMLYSEIKNYYGIAGLMGNIYAESVRSPICMTASKNASPSSVTEYVNRVDNGTISKDSFANDGIAFGLVQWRYYSRKEALYDFAKSEGSSIGDGLMQIRFLLKEIKTYKTVWATLQTATSVKEASDAVLLKYEKPANVGESAKNKRASYGEDYYNQLIGSDNVELKPEEPKTKYLVTTHDKVICRCGNGMTFGSIGRIAKKNTAFPLIATSENGWHAIKFNTQVGWVSSLYSKVEER